MAGGLAVGLLEDEILVSQVRIYFKLLFIFDFSYCFIATGNPK